MLVIIAAYGIWQARNFLRGPIIRLEIPREGEVFNERVVTVKGTALGAGHLLLNGRAILTNEKGEFSETYVLAPGVNDIEIRARDRFGHEETVRRMVFLK